MKLAKELIWRNTQAVLAQIDFKKQPPLLALKESRGKHIQSVIAQVKFIKTAEIPKKTFWKCSQFVALQMKFAQAAESLKDSRWKGFQLIPCHVEGPEAFQTVKMCSSRVIKLLLDRSR